MDFIMNFVIVLYFFVRLYLSKEKINVPPCIIVKSRISDSLKGIVLITYVVQ